MLQKFAKAELRMGGSLRAKLLWKIFILRGESRRREIRLPKVCIFHLSVNQYWRKNTLQNGSNFGSLPHPYTSISGWILPHVFLHYPKDPRNAFRWDLNILLNCGVPYPAINCSAGAGGGGPRYNTIEVDTYQLCGLDCYPVRSQHEWKKFLTYFVEN